MSASIPHHNPAHGISIQSLGSGSSGNAFVITTGSDTVLLDCGIGIRALRSAMKERKLDVTDITAICVTHEHSDHIRTLPKVIHADAELYATSGTSIGSRLPNGQVTRAIADSPITIAGITIWPLPVSHDAKEPCGFMLELPDGSRATMLTDLGAWHDSLRDFVRASDLIILEANHDEDMLRSGPYPAYLKRRVASDVGHFSNRDCGLALGHALRGTSHDPEIWLAHLSKENNRPDLAEQTVRDELVRHDLDLSVTALPRLSPSHIWTPRERTLPSPEFTRQPVLQIQQLGFEGF